MQYDIVADNGFIIATMDNASSPGSGTTYASATEAFNAYCTELGLDPAVYTSPAFSSADDGVAYIDISLAINTGKITFVPKLMISSEGGIGLYDVACATTAGTIVTTIPNTSRMYITSDKPTMLLTYHCQSDLKIANCIMANGVNGTCLKMTHSNYGDATNSYDMAIQISNNGFKFFASNIGYATPATTLNFYLDTFPRGTDTGSSYINQYSPFYLLSASNSKFEGILTYVRESIPIPTLSKTFDYDTNIVTLTWV